MSIASDNKKKIVKSLLTESWGYETAEGMFRDRTVLVHPTASGVTVGRFGGVFLHGMRVSWPNGCIRKAVTQQLMRHLKHDLSGTPENNR